ncbi:MAG: NAD(P)/FAD-dependent oxidoreductase [Thiogranum sp.]|nr:NAD(P)/FAD-dependent oxidoreductase [Thiogranum sp.]
MSAVATGPALEIDGDRSASPVVASPVVVIGTGPVGIRVVEELLQRDPRTPVVIYGNEPWEPYNRVRLSSLLTGELNLSGIQNPVRLPATHRVVQHHDCEIVSIDRERRIVTDRFGGCQRWSRLILATGSSPRIPFIEGIDKQGIFTFRNLNDAQRLMARRTRSRHAIVLGGGLLGLEAAWGLRKYHTQVTVLEHATRLMARQLDDDAAELLREHLLAQGIHILLGNSIKTVLGDNSISGVRLRSGREIACDTLVISAGIQPNIELARDAGLSVGTGIRVNDRMQTSDADIYAVGECAEHRNQVYGLVAPGLEQAGVAAHCILGGDSRFAGARSATRLKVVGVPVFSMGRTGEQEPLSQLKTVSWRGCDNRSYRRLLLRRNRLVGAIGFGEWKESSRVQEALDRSRIIWPWQQRRFAKRGQLWPGQDAADVNDWPAAAVVCQCTGVTRGTLSRALRAGHASVEALSEQTGAASVCGGCKPLLADLAGSAATAAEAGHRTLLWSGIAGLLAVLALLFLPPVPYANSVQLPVRWDRLWSDSLFKQISGFSLLGIGLLVSLISLRKRVTRFAAGAFSSWRLWHVVFGTLAAALLLAHTGLRLGSNLNLLLMLVFSALLLVGSVAGATIGVQHRLPRATARRTREVALWMHILLIWPLPVLLGFHVLKTYWF